MTNDRIAKIRERVKACEYPINEPSKIQAVGWMKQNAIEYVKDLLTEIDRLQLENMRLHLVLNQRGMTEYGAVGSCVPFEELVL